MGDYAEDPTDCDRDLVCHSLGYLPLLAYLATACVVVLVCVAVLAQRGFRRADKNRRLFVLPLVLVAPALVVAFVDWSEVRDANAIEIKIGGHPVSFPPPWMVWRATFPTIRRTALLLYATFFVVLLVLAKLWVHYFADRSV
jgi:hypothetical protein